MKSAVRYFGKEKTSLARRIAIRGLMASLGLSIYAMWTDFIPSAAWLHLGFYVSATSAALMTIYLYWGFGTGHIEMQKEISKLKKVFSLLFLPFFIFGIFWLVLVHGLPDIFTLTVGSQHQESTLLRKEYSSSRRSCDYQLTGELLSRAFPSFICISRSVYDALPSYPLAATLEGKITPLGFHVQHVNLGANSAVRSGSVPEALRR